MSQEMGELTQTRLQKIWIPHSSGTSSLQRRRGYNRGKLWTKVLPAQESWPDDPEVGGDKAAVDSGTHTFHGSADQAFTHLMLKEGVEAGMLMAPMQLTSSVLRAVVQLLRSLLLYTGSGGMMAQKPPPLGWEWW
ncbi:6-phosphofructo-2-kinase/fructose-2,6-biphosphatase 1 [Heterocephalus glaber]|uniref:6-phosphofructo-2-kinase/fructose-2, 6-biphosphatase 1 n=1 Tax=Heterocephalus glaber TaxID=10181 RepID=G5BHQ6_HETGA|nr:6-phosphofructo-2-kinase/fructose-2,6-biphosphatase 1 [Heterocephalus glaber]